ncbi:hypothetical protein DM860_002867 [Cuscuta australis]|uniref:Uncharacterized protein n=1 Tax=Cuscuta australis TaxID=267555 RepID=A0A328D1F3_9ASTE|nr:hypothetical protein DM860_002867 [Cuscuta australis]
MILKPISVFEIATLLHFNKEYIILELRAGVGDICLFGIAKLNYVHYGVFDLARGDLQHHLGRRLLCNFLSLFLKSDAQADVEGLSIRLPGGNGGARRARKINVQVVPRFGLVRVRFASGCYENSGSF